MLLKRAKRAGFTLIELIAVCVGLGVAFLCVLAAIGLILWACGVFK